jgi:acyl-coenzyme A thioesterase PaaI-like protein
MTLRLSPPLFRLVMNLWPPYLGAGICVEHIAPDFRSVTVALVRRWYNRNYVGTHFGGSLYAMTDPFFALMVMRNLTSDYSVWDRSASIDYLAPGRGRVWARFELTEADLKHIRRMTEGGDKHLHMFTVDVRDSEGMAIAHVEKIVYVRRKRRAI